MIMKMTARDRRSTLKSVARILVRNSLYTTQYREKLLEAIAIVTGMEKDEASGGIALEMLKSAENARAEKEARIKAATQFPETDDSEIVYLGLEELDLPDFLL